MKIDMDFTSSGAIFVGSTVIAICMGLAACSTSNNPILGRVEAEVGHHQVVVIDCYTFHDPGVQSSDDGERFAPCKDAVVSIRDDMLYVNGDGYGHLNEGDSVLVNHGKVKIEPR
jgi:hypothetical protein